MNANRLGIQSADLSFRSEYTSVIAYLMQYVYRKSLTYSARPLDDA